LAADLESPCPRLHRHHGRRAAYIE
jgi:hypothetical protein